MAATSPRKSRLRALGAAKVVSELAIGDGSTALDITGYWLDETGMLDAAFRILQLVPTSWPNVGPSDPTPSNRGVLAILACTFEGSVPEILMLTTAAEDGSTGSVWRYAPWTRSNGLDSAGWEEQFFYNGTVPFPVVAPKQLRFRPCMQQVGDAVFFTFGDGAGIYVWDRVRVRRAGFFQNPGTPSVEGPSRSSSPNSGGFSVKGRVGNRESTLLDTSGEVVGGVDDFQRRYALVWQNASGAYSPMSALSGVVSMRLDLAAPGATPAEYMEDLLRRFRTLIPDAPENVQAQLLLGTPNLCRLLPGDDGTPRLLHRITHSGGVEYMDDIPDGELGQPWQNRVSLPQARYIGSFGGSMFYIGTDGFPARVWWSEQTLAGSFPESILEGHWTDVYPQTGEIRAACTARVRSTQGFPTFLFFKASSVHYLMGSYPSWQVGTLHMGAGCAGWDLVQVAPDGSVVWYGSRTFWIMTPDGNVEDIGGPIRRRIRRINPVFEHLGTSGINMTYGEVIFCLPLDDSTVNNYQFIWDFRLHGWRFREDVAMVCMAAIPGTDLLLVGGSYQDDSDVYIYGRGQSQDAPTRPTATYISGWTGYSEEGESTSTPFNTMMAAWIMQDRYEGTVDMNVYKDWNLDTPDTTLTLSLSSPEDDSIRFYAAADSPARYGVDSWRTSRIFTQTLQVETDSFTVIAIGISTDQPHVIVGAEILADRAAGVGERGPRSPESTS